MRGGGAVSPDPILIGPRFDVVNQQLIISVPRTTGLYRWLRVFSLEAFRSCTPVYTRGALWGYGVYLRTQDQNIVNSPRSEKGTRGGPAILTAFYGIGAKHAIENFGSGFMPYQLRIA
jgi:hypothetical protein